MKDKAERMGVNPGLGCREPQIFGIGGCGVLGELGLMGVAIYYDIFYIL